MECEKSPEGGVYLPPSPPLIFGGIQEREGASTPSSYLIYILFGSWSPFPPSKTPEVRSEQGTGQDRDGTVCLAQDARDL